MQDESDENDEVGLEGLPGDIPPWLAREQTPGSWVTVQTVCFLRGQSYENQALAAVKDQVPWLHLVESPRSTTDFWKSLKPAGLPHLTGL